MISRKKTLVAAAALFALTTFDAAYEATASNHTGRIAYCHWYRQLAMNTGQEYWWERWRLCIRGWDWKY